jgi:hypothetical protein
VAKLADLGGAAEKILAAFVAQLEAQGVELPERQYRAPGSQIVWDGEQLTVRLLGLHQGQPGAEIGFGMHPAAVNVNAQFAADLVRAVPGSTLGLDGSLDELLPSAEQIDPEGAVLLADASALLKAATAISLADYDSTGTAYGVVFPGESMVVGPLQTVGPEGGMAATRLTISLTAD